MRRKARAQPFLVSILLLLPVWAADPASAQDRDVRIVLPLLFDAKPTDHFVRIGPDPAKQADIGAVCELIAGSADAANLPRPFLARLIWNVSKFDATLESPRGAQGIAQLSPEIAFKRGVRNAFDVNEAIPALAGYLADLREKLGNLGLATATYKAGEARVSRWLDKGGYLPADTDDFLLAVLGRTASTFRGPTPDEEQKPLAEGKSFEEACRALPGSPANADQFSGVEKPAWGVQLAGNFDQAAAMKQWESVRAAHPALLADIEPAVFLARSKLGRKPLFVVQVAAETQAQAQDFCGRLQADGGACVVVRNN